MLDDRISALIARIYDGAFDARAWEGAIAEMLERTGSQSALFAPTDLESGELFQCRYFGDDSSRLLDAVRDYTAELYHQDPMLRFGLRHPEAGFVRLSMAVPAAEQDEDEYVRWFRSRMSVRDYVVRYTPPRDGLSLAIALVPRAGEAVHRSDQLDLFSVLFDHIGQATRIAARLPLMALSESGEAVVLVDRHGRVVEMTDAARTLIARGDGLKMADGHLLASRPGEQRRLDAMLSAGVDAARRGAPAGDLALKRQPGRRPLLLWISALPEGVAPLGAMGAAAMVRIIDPEMNVVPGAGRRWAAMFGLTPAEGRLAAALLADETNLRTAAHTLGIAYATARVQLASLFEKTGVSSQAQLARLLTRIGV